jgi:hypothetical protein
MFIFLGIALGVPILASDILGGTHFWADTAPLNGGTNEALCSSCQYVSLNELTFNLRSLIRTSSGFGGVNGLNA